MFKYNPRHTSQSHLQGSQNGWLFWSYNIGSSESSPAIGSDGNIYVGSSDNRLYAISSRGAFAWSYKTDGTIDIASPALNVSGDIYVRSWDSRFYAIDHTGSLRWSYHEYVSDSSPVVEGNGTCYFGTDDNLLYSLDANGSLDWSYRQPEAINASPALGLHGEVYVPNYDNYLYCHTSDGSFLWSYNIAGDGICSPAVGFDGRVYVPNSDEMYYCISSIGSLLWSYATGGDTRSSFAVDSNETLYIGSMDNRLYSLKSDGTSNWSYLTGGGIYSAPTLGSDGVIYFGSYDNVFYGINPDDSLLWSYGTGADIGYSSAAISGDRQVYFVSKDGYLYSIADYTPLPTVTPTMSPTLTPSGTPTETPTPTPTATPTRTPTPTPTPTYTPLPTPTPTPSPIAAPTITPTPEPTVTVPPGEISVPTGLRAVAGADNIMLTWNPNPESFLKGYNLYRDTANSGAFTYKVNGEEIQGTRFVDNGLALGQIYYYRLTAVDTSGRESPKSAMVWATVGNIRIWMPDYRGKAGDEVRLRISVENARGIAANAGIDIRVTYDATLLSYVGVEKTAITKNLQVMSNTVGGTVLITALGDGTLVGEGHLFHVIFKVSDHATTGQTAMHSFTLVEMYDSASNLLPMDHTDTSTFTVASDYILGDLNGDGQIRASDAALATRISIGEVAPTSLQMNAGDINADRVIDSSDVVSIMRIAVGLPINPSGGILNSTDRSSSAVDNYILSLPSMDAEAGQTLTVPLEVNDASLLSGADINVNYDPNVLTLIEVNPGDPIRNPALKWRIAREGVAVISLGEDTALSGGSGNIVQLTFQVAGETPAGTESPLKLSRVKMSGEYGNDLSWKSNVEMVDGLVRVGSRPTPTPTPYITARLWTDQETYRPGDTHVLYYSLTPNVDPRLLKADAYMLLKTPYGYHWYNGKKRFSSHIKPVVTYPTAPKLDGIAYWFRTPDGHIREKRDAECLPDLTRQPKGRYTWYGVIVWHGTSPFNQHNWLSNLATAQFEIKR
jgi:outer membrane protein assembly factor BamB